MATTVNADWTAEHVRDIAKPAPMIVTGIISDIALSNFSPQYPVPAPQEEAESSDKSKFAAGSCFCGRVQLELPLDLKPAISVVCHCTDCRQWHSVGSVPYMMFPLAELHEKGGKIPIKVCRSIVPLFFKQVVSGASLLAFVHRTPEVRRYFTTCCGSRVFNSVWNENMGLKLCGTFPTIFPTYEWQPTMHVNVRESNYPTLDVTKWNDLPKEFGGTGTKPKK